MNKFISLGATLFLMIASFFPQSILFYLAIIAMCLLIAFYALKFRMNLVAIERETPRLMLAKIISEFFILMPVAVAVFLFIDVDYRWAFVTVLTALIGLQIAKIFYWIYAKSR